MLHPQKWRHIQHLSRHKRAEIGAPRSSGVSYRLLLNIRHLGVDKLIHRRTSLRTPVALKDGRTGGPAARDPRDRLRRQYLLGGRTVSSVWLNHPFDEV